MSQQEIIDVSSFDKDLIIVKQLPVIEEQLITLSDEIDRRIADALSLEVTEETVKTVKQLRAGLTKEFTFLEDKRKEVKRAVLSPYEKFEATYKQYVSDKYTTADAQLKKQIDAVENGLKKLKRTELEDFFNENCEAFNIDFVSMAAWSPNVTMSASLKSLKDSAREYLYRIADNLVAIETMEHSAEILVEFRRSLNLSEAIALVANRHKAIEEEQRRKVEQEARRAAGQAAAAKVQEAIQAQRPLEPPKVVAQELPPVINDPVKTLVFKVTEPVPRLKEIKKFLDDGGYRYE